MVAHTHERSHDRKQDAVAVVEEAVPSIGTFGDVVINAKFLKRSFELGAYHILYGYCFTR